MIYVAVTDLLNGLRRLLTTPRREFEFIGTDSSFRLLFRRVKIDGVDVTYRGIAIEQESLTHVARAAVEGACRLVSTAPLPPSDSVAGDIAAAIAELRACLHD